MSIAAGRRLGPYEILSAIGAGGMGEVYKARDTRLDRIVAIKVLPAHLADRAELRDRFEREAKTIASLDHPHICTLYDTGRQDEVDFLVMEYLEGETLAQRLQKGPLPIQQVLLYAIEISDALDKAHRKGITHRDLKPGNIMLTKLGTKLLDFGLAKLTQDGKPATPYSESPTEKDAITAEGTVLGTLQYMAPEQVEGKEADARTDIFAFGAVVYEMATGKKAFEGKSQASLIAKILERDPLPMSSIQPMTPPALDRVVKKCLAKEPDDRWHAAKDLCDELKWISGDSSQAASAPNARMKGVRALGRRELILTSGASVLGAVAGGIAFWKLEPAPSAKPVIRAVITLPPGQELAGLEDGSAVALSLDGTHLAYVARQGSTQQIYLRAMDSMESKPIPGTEGGVGPFFSPDGQWVGFFVGAKLKKVSVSGGAAISLADAAFPRGASWSNQGAIIFAPSGGSLIQQVADAGGTSHPITRLEEGDISQRWPEFMPGGDAVLFDVGATANNSVAGHIAIQSVRTGQRVDLTQGGTYPKYASSGHLIYAQDGSLMAVPFDLRQFAVIGVAVPVVEGVLQSPINGGAQYSFSSTGSLVYVAGGIQSAQRKMVWVNRNGAEVPLTIPAHSYRAPRISPDGNRVAVSIEEQETQLWLYDLSRETLTRSTFAGGVNENAIWTPDGKRIVFQSSRDGPLNIFWQMADGSGEMAKLISSEHTDAPHSWSPDGQLLAFIDINPATGIDVMVLRLSDHKVQPFLQTRFNEGAPRFSPDGHWLAYISDESGRYEVYVQPYPGPGGKWQISTDGGTEPVWNCNGRELFYRNGDRMMAVEITARPTFSAGTPHMLFEGRYIPSPTTFQNYDVTPDGKRFLMLKSVEQAQTEPTQINIVQNWFEELRQKAPTGKK